MSGGANRRFCSNPVNFLRNHPIFPSSMESRMGRFDDWVVKVNLELHSTAPVYLVKPVPAAPSENSRNFWAYYLKYIDTGVTRTTLGDQADYFFTDSLSGCTVSCGRGKKPLVIHYNWKDTSLDSGKIDQARIDNDINTTFGTNKHGEVRQGDYQIGEGIGATVVGVRDKKSGDWAFYYQVYNKMDRVLIVQSI